MNPKNSIIIWPAGTVVNANGSSKEIHNKYAKEALFRANVTVDNGTSIDIDLEYYDEAAEAWVVLGSFAQITTTGASVLHWGDPVANEFLPRKLRFSWTLVGTSFTMSLGGEMG